MGLACPIACKDLDLDAIAMQVQGSYTWKIPRLGHRLHDMHVVRHVKGAEVRRLFVLHLPASAWQVRPSKGDNNFTWMLCGECAHMKALSCAAEASWLLGAPCCRRFSRRCLPDCHSPIGSIAASGHHRPPAAAQSPQCSQAGRPPETISSPALCTQSPPQLGSNKAVQQSQYHKCC